MKPAEFDGAMRSIAQDPQSEISPVIARRLESDGMASIVWSTDGEIICAELTPKGKAFARNGGYTAAAASARSKALRSKLKWLAATLIAAAIPLLAELLKGPLSRWWQSVAP